MSRLFPNKRIRNACIVISTILLLLGSMLLATTALAQGAATGSSDASIDLPNRSVTPGIIERVSVLETVAYPDGTETKIKEMEITLEDGTEITTTVERLTGDTFADFTQGDRVVINVEQFEEGSTQYFVADHLRWPRLALLASLFVVVVLAVAGRHGMQALLGLAFSFGVIFWFLLPKLNAGWTPLPTVIAAATMIIGVSYVVSHGWRKITLIAGLGTLLALIVTALLAQGSILLTNLSGFGTEEIAFLQTMMGNDFNPRSLLLAGIILGGLGVLDDITISQASIVSELRKANKKLSNWELFKRSMKVGRDHIASLVNTLILVYAGAALPLLLLFTSNNFELWYIVNFEIVAEEIVRMLVASCGLIIAVPITSALAAFGSDLLDKIAAKIPIVIFK